MTQIITLYNSGYSGHRLTKTAQLKTGKMNATEYLSIVSNDMYLFMATSSGDEAIKRCIP